MTIRSKLFATVALPVLSLSLVMTPAMAKSQNSSWLVAQAESDDGQALGGEEAPLKKKKKHKQSEEQAPAEAQQEEQAPAAEPQPQEEAPAAEPQQQEEAPAAEQAPAVEEQAPAEQPEAKPEKKSKKHKQQAQEAPAEEAPGAEAPVEEQPQQQEAAPAEEPAAAAQPEAEQPKKKKKKHKEAEPAAEQAAPAEQSAPAVEEPAPAVGETGQAPAEEAAPAATEQAPAEQAAPEAKEKKKNKGKNKKDKATAEEPATAEPDATAPAASAPDATAPDATAPDATAPDAATPDATAPAGKTEGQSGAEAPAATDAANPATDAPVPAADNSLTQEEKAKIAADPSQTTDTVVLPVENGAAVLDSDKDATGTNGTSKEERTKARAAEEVAPAPTTDADAQGDVPVLERKAVQAAIEEQGTKVSEAPEFAVPGVTNVTNNVTNNTVINNTVTNNTVNNTESRVTVVNQVDDTTVLDVGGRIVVRSDDRPRLRMDSSDSYYEELSRGRTRETIVRENGSRIVTVYNAYGDIIQRSRVSRDGEEYVMIYAPEADTEKERRIYDAGYDLPPMRLTIPVDDYIISTSAEPREDYYTFLEKPPVERVERVYSLDEVKYSARIRDKVRRIDLDTITFATGSAEVPLSQAKSLRKVADAMLKVLKKDPGETFLIEGHTDAVGSDQSNLVLSDERAGSVASLLTEVYGIPPENLTTQGYGERYLKIRTAGAEQQNRRVTIRRVTALIRPVAKAD